MRVKIISLLCIVLLLSSLFSISALASGEVTKSQTVNFFDLEIGNLVAKTTYSDGHTNNITLVYQGIYSYGALFPSNGSYTHAARRWGFADQGQGAVSLGQTTKIVESYDLPKWDFNWFDMSISVTYVSRIDAYHTGNNASNVILRIGDISYQPSTISQETTQKGTVFQWTVSLNGLSSLDFRSISFETVWDYPVTIQSPAYFYSGVFPLMVSTSYSQADAFSNATLDILSNGISPTLEHIEEQMENTAAELSRVNAQASAINSNFAALPSRNQAAMSQALEEHDQAQYEWGIDQGKSQAEDLISLVPTDKINHAGGSFQLLASVLDTNKRTCYWEFPSMYIPAINGVTEKITLNQKIPIAVHEWFDKMPVSIITLVRAVCTCGLGLFFVRELMFLIRAIPRQGGGSDNG